MEHKKDEKLNKIQFVLDLQLICIAIIAFNSIEMLGSWLGTLGSICGIALVILLLYLRNFSDDKR